MVPSVGLTIPAATQFGPPCTYFVVARATVSAPSLASGVGLLVQRWCRLDEPDQRQDDLDQASG